MQYVNLLQHSPTGHASFIPYDHINTAAWTKGIAISVSKLMLLELKVMDSFIYHNLARSQ